MIDLLWHQWSSIGAAGYARPDDKRIIDPEALILATTRFGRHDSRLMDEAVDWLVKFGNRISLQRLQGLNKNWPGVADPRVLAAIAEVIGRQVAHRKWRVLVDESVEASEPEGFFIGKDGKPISNSMDADPTFSKHGLMRGALDLRGMSQAPDPQNRQNLIFTLRALLGVNARAEIMAWLLTHESGHPAAIARSTGYFSKSIQQILNEMAESGQVASIRIGREKHFSVPRRESWQELLCPATEDAAGFPVWVDWMPLFSVVTHFAETIGKPGLDDTSEHFQAAKLRDALYDCTAALAQAGRVHAMQAKPGLRGASLVNALLADLEKLLD
ncbi:hypothetical protein HZ994_15250 [Akkermansiaceae bacterium]|nr:hypothetical protein HZ994_15250 [Akkermansiaceae bacterium]